MKIILILFNIVFLGVLLSAPALKRVSISRLLTFTMLMLYSVGIFKLICLFPLITAFSLGAGMLVIVFIAILPRQQLFRQEITAAGHKIHKTNRQRNDIRIRKKNISLKEEYMLPESIF